MSEIIELETIRLRLRQWRDADRAPFAALNADPEVMEYFPAPQNRRSRTIMERIGRVNANADFDYPGLPEGHPLRRHCLYRLKKADGLKLHPGAAE